MAGSDSGSESDDDSKNIFRRLPKHLREQAMARTEGQLSGRTRAAPLSADYVLPPGINFPQHRYVLDCDEDEDDPKPKPKPKAPPKVIDKDSDSDDGGDITCLKHRRDQRAHTLPAISAPALPPSPEEMLKELRQQGNSKFKQGLFDEASCLYSRALDVFRKQHGDLPTEASVLLCNRSICYRRMGRVHDALEDAKKAAQLNPSTPKPLYLQAAAENEIGMCKAALSTCLQAVEMLDGKEDRSIQTLLEECQKSVAGSQVQARVLQERLYDAQAIEDSEKESTCWAQMAEFQGQLGDYETAVVYSKEYLNITREMRDRPGEADAYSQLRRWYEKLGQTEEFDQATNDFLGLALDDSRRIAPHMDPMHDRKHDIL